jgi:hypothetical protein
MDEPVYLVGYWNGNEKDPEITFYIKECDKDTRKLVHITLELIKEEDSSKKVTRAARRADKAVKKLLKAIKHLEK